MDTAMKPYLLPGKSDFQAWRTSDKVAWSKQSITASFSVMCSNTAKAELTTGSNTPPTDSTSLRVTTGLQARIQCGK